MSLQTVADIPIQVTSENSSSERRITPAWTIGQLKAKLEPITGIPPLSQKLTLRLGGQQSVPLEASDEENTQLARFPLAPYAEIYVCILEFICNNNTFSSTSPVCDTMLEYLCESACQHLTTVFVMAIHNSGTQANPGSSDHSDTVAVSVDPM
jgi:hypothetical protein